MNFPNDMKKFGPAPTHYIAGFGRGAVGFTTRSDIGPARLTLDPPAFGAPPTGYVAGLGRGAQAFNKDEGGEGGDREFEDYSDAKYDEWSGYGGSLFSLGDYDDEGKEADEIYSMIDKHMDSRRKQRRERKAKEDLEKLRAERPSIGQQFAGLKKDLTKLKMEDWLNIPEIGDYSVKKVKRERYVPVPDKIILNAAQDSETVGSIAVKDGTQSSITNNLNDVGEARGTVLTLKLDKLSDSVSGRSNVDAKGYLTDLNSLPTHDAADIGDYKKARTLLKSVINTNPKNPAGWIAAARVEKLDGKLLTARNILAQGLQNCPESEDLWLEAVVLETPEKVKSLLARAVASLPKSVKLWLEAANKETEKAVKSKVLRRALENVPNSIRLWRELIELEGESEAKTLLHKAVECVPHCLEMWLALAKLESYDNAKIILNKARQSLPTEHSIWVHAAQLEESQGREKTMIDGVVKRGLHILQKNGFKIKREEWLTNAINAEKSGNPLTCAAIIKATIGEGLEEEDKERVWLEEAEQNDLKDNPITARAIYAHSLEYFKVNKSIWLKAIQFETKLAAKKPNEDKYMDELLQSAIKECPKEEIFWLTSAKQKWQKGDYASARVILLEANAAIANNENIYLASAKLEKDIGEIEKARKWLSKAREKCITSVKVWLRSIKLEKQEKKYDDAWELCSEAIKRFPGVDKVWSSAAEIKIEMGKLEEAKEIYEKAIESIKTSPHLWISYINFEADQGNFPRARSILENAKVRIKKSIELWLACINLECKAKNLEGALYFIAKGLQELPNSGELWALAIELEPKATRKTKIVAALKNCENDPLVLTAVAKLFWKEKKLDKAIRWIERAVALKPKLGDAWAYYIRIVEETDSKEMAEDVRRRCIESEPKLGDIWMKCKKEKRKTEEVLGMVLDYIDNEDFS